MKSRREAETHRLIAGVLCLDFANTLNGHSRANGHEYLRDFRDLVLWCRHAKLLNPGEAKLALREERCRSPMARAVFARSIRLRESIFRIFHALARRKPPRASDLRSLDQAWKQGQLHAHVLHSKDGFAVGWNDDSILELIPRRLSVSAVELLTSGGLTRVRACSGEGCDWLFVDSSRNHLRRWCSMDECGNRAKMRRRQARKRPTGTT
jgi:predicted RNA-binding Zn ribbon-like protein